MNSRYELSATDAPEVVGEWIDELGDTSDEFADSVISAWLDERSAADCGEGQDTVVAIDAGRGRRWAVAAVTALAAAAAIIVAVQTGGRTVATPSSTGQGCDVADAGEVPSAETTLPGLRTQMRGLIAARCVPCHLGGHDKSDPLALEAFDVEADELWDTMSDRQLGVMEQRLHETGIDAQEATLVDSFVAAESDHRG